MAILENHYCTTNNSRKVRLWNADQWGPVETYAQPPLHSLSRSNFLHYHAVFSKQLWGNRFAPILGISGSATANTFSQCCGFCHPQTKFGARLYFQKLVCQLFCLQGVSVWCHFLSGCLIPCSYWDGGSLSRRVCRDTPHLEFKKRTVRILLECFLSRNRFSHCCKLDHRISDKFSWRISRSTIQ